MSIRVALHHQTVYHYDRLVSLSPQVIRLRPAPHCRTPIISYSLKVEPENQFLNWQQDPYGNFLARVVVPDKTLELKVEVDLVTEMTVINPFDFFLEPEANDFPFTYSPVLQSQLQPYCEKEAPSAIFDDFVNSAPRKSVGTVDFLVDLNRYVHDAVKYVIRLEPGVQTCVQTLERGSGSCRDSAWLLAQLVRHLGLAARFVSGYLIQLKPDVVSLDGPSGAEVDFTDLHAWTEVFLPGAGWVGLDPTSGLLAGEGHIPLAATPDPESAAPISGATDKCETTFGFEMSVKRIHEDPRVTKPYTDEQWTEIERLGEHVDRVIAAGVKTFTMGGEPTFVSIDDRDGPEWNTAALGETKRKLAGTLFNRLAAKFANQPLLHYGQGKWYPGEQLPRWALSCYWRKDKDPIWTQTEWLAVDGRDYQCDENDARAFMTHLAEHLRLDVDHIIPGFEDVWFYMLRERKLPVNVDPLKSKLQNEEDRKRIAKVFEQGLDKIVGYVLPLRPTTSANDDGREDSFDALMPIRWESGRWFLRQEHLFLIPGDSPMGYRLPLDSLPWIAPEDLPHIHERDPLDTRSALPRYGQFGGPIGGSSRDGAPANEGRAIPTRLINQIEGFSEPENGREKQGVASHDVAALASFARHRKGDTDSKIGGEGDSDGEAAAIAVAGVPATSLVEADAEISGVPEMGKSAKETVRTAICVEARAGALYVFMPPVAHIEEYLDLVGAIESTAAKLKMPVRIEGYTPPHDPRIDYFRITPDPGVIEVNLQPAKNWRELVHNTDVLYEEARQSRLCTEKFMLDGRHTGTGGGNHIVLGGPTPAESPFLRRPDLLRSLIAYWNNRPSLSYLFSGLFIGPTSQAPRADEARHESIYELDIACAQLPEKGPVPPWLVDRVFRHLLVDLTGNTHRAEFCIDKLYSPDSSTGRLGLLELRGFEMPPHERMSLTQQLLVRAMVAKFWINLTGSRSSVGGRRFTIDSCCPILSPRTWKKCWKISLRGDSSLTRSGSRRTLNSAFPSLEMSFVEE